jgi:hypothetical protein
MRGIAPWLWDLNKNFPALKRGKFYFSLTPLVSGREWTKGGIPIGFEGDEDYFGRLGGWFLRRKFCVPASVRETRDMGAFYEKTREFLIRARDELTFISVWNPTFLMILMDGVDTGIFRKLRVISCWADGNAKPLAGKLRERFPGVHIQPKGLLATEGIVTIPLEGVGKRLSGAHFFEFQDENGALFLPDALEEGGIYDVVMTTAGGFYRYKIGDLVRYRGGMCFDFLGKSGNVSDFFGEKLNEGHVRECLRDVRADFRLVAIDGDGYALYVDADVDVPAEELDRRLRGNFHYDYCRRLGQLRPLRIFRVSGDAQAQYIAACVKNGQRAGDVKPLTLSARGGFSFNGEWL